MEMCLTLYDLHKSSDVHVPKMLYRNYLQSGSRKLGGV